MILSEKRDKRFRSVIEGRLQDVIVLENIHDPHNALAAIRNCDAFGIQTVHFIFEKEKQFNPEKLGKATSSSANKWVDAVCWEKTEDCLESLKKDGFRIVATIIDKKAKQLSETDFLRQKVALVFGNEGFGITDTAKRLADDLVYIPMNGFVDSLNLSVTVGVTLYELSKHRRGIFQLSDREQQRLYDKWMKDEMRKKYRL
jgi:tRNA (guanosine-2'-O-)-methyltransferase